MRSEADEKRIRERWHAIMAYVIATKSQGQLLDSNIAPNRMALSRWRKNPPAPEVIWATLRCLFGDRASQMYEEGDAWLKHVTLPRDIGTLRRSLGITQLQLAQVIGVSRFTMNKAEHGLASDETVNLAWHALQKMLSDGKRNIHLR